MATAGALVPLSSSLDAACAVRQGPAAEAAANGVGSDRDNVSARGIAAALAGRGGARATRVAAWALASHGQLLSAAADAEARRRRLAGLRDAHSVTHSAATDLDKHAVVHFLGRVVAVSAAPSGGGRARPVLWVWQGGASPAVEVSLAPVQPPGGTHRRAASASDVASSCMDVDAVAATWRARLEGRVVELFDASVRYRSASNRYCLVAAEASDAVSGGRWRVIPEDDPRAADVVARCPVARAVSTRPTSLAELRRRPPVDAPVVVVRARVAWVRLPPPPKTNRPSWAFAAPERDGGGRLSAAKRRRLDDGGADHSLLHVESMRELVAASLLSYGCRACGRCLRPDPADGIFRQCPCHPGGTNTTGYVWRSLTLGLVDDADPDGDACADDETTGADGGDRPRCRVVAEAHLDGPLVSRLLLGVQPGDAAWSMRRRRRKETGTGERSEAASGAGTREPADADDMDVGDMAVPGGELDESDVAAIDWLGVAAAALVALTAGGPDRNTPFEWRVRAPSLDENGVPKTGALEVLGFHAPPA